MKRLLLISARAVRELLPSIMISISLFQLVTSVVASVFGEYYTADMSGFRRTTMVRKTYVHFGISKWLENPANVATLPSGVPTFTFYDAAWQPLHSWKDSDSPESYVCSTFPIGSDAFVEPNLSEDACAAAATNFMCSDLSMFGESGCIMNTFVHSTQTCYRTCASPWAETPYATPILGTGEMHFTFFLGPIYADLLLLLWFVIKSPRRFEITDDVSLCFHLCECYAKRVNVFKRTFLVWVGLVTGFVLLFIVYPIILGAIETATKIRIGFDGVKLIRENISSLILILLGVANSLKGPAFATDYLVYKDFPKDALKSVPSMAVLQKTASKAKVTAPKQTPKRTMCTKVFQCVMDLIDSCSILKPASEIVTTEATRVLALRPKFDPNSSEAIAMANAVAAVARSVVMPS